MTASKLVDLHLEATEVDHHLRVTHRGTVEDIAPLREGHRHPGGIVIHLQKDMEVGQDQEIVIWIPIGRAHTRAQGRPERDRDRSHRDQGLALRHEEAKDIGDGTVHHHLEEEGEGEGEGEVLAIRAFLATVTGVVVEVGLATEGEGEIARLWIGCDREVFERLGKSRVIERSL